MTGRMTPPSLSEIAFALHGSIQLARLDAGGLTLFNRTVAGFWRSFYAAGLVAPLHIYVLLAARELADSADPLRVITVETISYVIGWLAYPFVMLLVVDLLGRRERYFDYMVPYNWTSVPVAVALAMVVTVAALSPMLGGVLYLLLMLARLIYQWFIARVSLRIASMPAIALALFEFALGMALGRITQALLQVPIPA
jgi:hypothetical protein